jgi:hypothetical protein
MPPPPLVLSMLCCLLSADAFPPVCLLFASWLLHCPLILLMHHLCNAMCCRLLSTSPTHLPAGCHVASCCPASTSRHLLSCRHLTCPSLPPWLHLHGQDIMLHIVALPPPPVLSSTPPPLNAPQPHVTPTTPPLVCLLFVLTGCHIASCGTSTSHLPACPPLHLHLLSHLICVALTS